MQALVGVDRKPSAVEGLGGKCFHLLVPTWKASEAATGFLSPLGKGGGPGGVGWVATLISKE